MATVKLRLLLVTLCAAIALSGCTVSKYSAKNQMHINANAGATVDDRLSMAPQIAKLNNQTYKHFSVFDGKYVTITSPDVPVSVVLYTISRDLGLNLIVEPGVSIEGNLVTVNFKDTPVDEALAVVMDLADMFYSIDGNVLVVKRYETQYYNVPYIPAVVDYQSSIGGDVLGGTDTLEGSGSSSSSGGDDSELSGEFSIEYTRPEGTSDFYAEIERNLKDILASSSASAAPAVAGVAVSGGANEFYTINRATGTATVKTTRKKMKQVDDFFERVFAKAQRQVLIEARIVDIILSDEWSYGIDWSAVVDTVSIGQTITALVPQLSAPAGTVAFTDPSGNLSAVLEAVGSFGNTETLSNPRMLVLNGQTALITAGTVTPYWENETTTTSTSAGFNTETESTKTNVLEGVMLGVTPFVNEDGTITMNIVPVSTTIEGDKQNIQNGIVVAEAPILNIKEAGTTIQADDGTTVILGGLITTRDVVDITRVPLLGDIPFLGYLFRSETHRTEKRELVIFLKPTIIYTNGARD